MASPVPSFLLAEPCKENPKAGHVQDIEQLQTTRRQLKVHMAVDTRGQVITLTVTLAAAQERSLVDAYERKCRGLQARRSSWPSCIYGLSHAHATHSSHDHDLRNGLMTPSELH